MIRKNLVLLTKGYPFGFSEASFLDEEIKIILENHNIILSVAINGGERRSERSYKGESLVYQPNNVVSLGLKFKFYIKIVLPFLLNIFPKFMVYKTSSQNIKHVLSQLLKYLDMAIYLERIRGSRRVDYFYSYWLDHWNMAACIHKVLFKTEVQVISRAHRFELVKETSKLGFFPFHPIQFKCSDKIVFISTTLRDHYLSLYPAFEDKMLFHPLGVKNGVKELNGNDSPEGSEYGVVCISDIKPIKNLELVAKALRGTGLKISWFHFGASKDNDILLNMLRGSSVSYHNMGFWENEKLQEFLQNSFFHFLINTSRSEGVPVSMMEAISCGIPIVATNVGGVNELVCDETGILVEGDIDSSALTEVIKEALVNYKFLGKKRMRVKEFAFKYFNAQNNYTAFSKLFNSEIIL